MSALLSLGEANHVILNADAEIGYAKHRLDPVAHAAQIVTLERAQAQLTQARAALQAVRLAISTHPIREAAVWNEEMAKVLREGAFLQRVGPHAGLHAEADRHERHAKALRNLIGE